MARFFSIVSALLYLVLLVPALRPATDLDVARLFYEGDHRFVGATPAGIAVRYVAWAAPFALMLALLVVAALARLGVIAPGRAPKGQQLLFLVATLAVGPGLLVHATLKEISHRPRPYNVAAFGGPDTFRPFFRFDGACRHNCSFPSGETAAAAWTIAPASLVPPPWRGAAMAVALGFTGFVAVWRMAFGAHFLSDVCGAALIVMLVIWLARGVLLRGAGATPPDPPGRTADPALYPAAGNR